MPQWLSLPLSASLSGSPLIPPPSPSCALARHLLSLSLSLPYLLASAALLMPAVLFRNLSFMVMRLIFGWTPDVGAPLTTPATPPMAPPGTCVCTPYMCEKGKVYRAP